MTMIERDQQADMTRQQHAVAEHVARHVADTDAGEVLRLAVTAHGAEVALDRLPCALGGNAHALVVVTVGATRRERVAQPETVLDRDRIGDIGERGRALVGCHHQVRIIRVVAHHVVRSHDLAFHQIVGDVEQAADEHAVAGDALGQLRVAVTIHRRTLDEETALGTHRHDDGVLHHLRLHQAQHLGTEVFAAIGPTQAATCHRTKAQVDAFHARRADEDLAIRHRLGQLGHAMRVELVADVAAVHALPLLEEAGA